ncbi:DUF305 domain-containing protein [Microbacterium hominis]|uniref:DUF305 domain-containing protein n=1 Tax=Microbacterium hominis TaxID=162426 RepID=A0A7D4PL51_9MICO|nr:DUF305 domain-containing protein [Microbacterium hominis]QKJ18675.1 DUF305 domain-containing protein [Microbacterium hominis]
MRKLIAGIGLIVAVATGFGAVATVVLGSTPPDADAAPAASAATAAAPATPVVMIDERYPTTVDYCYVEAMIPHHAQALELSGLVLAAGGVGERTRALAEFIVADQSAEIDTMRAWQTAWQKALPPGAGDGSAAHSAHDAAAGEIARGCHAGAGHGHGRMAGMATPAQLAALGEAEGAAAERLFLDLMIVHHEGALEMAALAVTEGANAFVRSSAKHVLVEQEKEIAAMTALRELLP